MCNFPHHWASLLPRVFVLFSDYQQYFSFSCHHPRRKPLTRIKMEMPAQFSQLFLKRPVNISALCWGLYGKTTCYATFVTPFRRDSLTLMKESFIFETPSQCCFFADRPLAQDLTHPQEPTTPSALLWTRVWLDGHIFPTNHKKVNGGTVFLELSQNVCTWMCQFEQWLTRTGCAQYFWKVPPSGKSRPNHCNLHHH